MNKRKLILWTLMLFAMGAGVFSCGGDEDPPPSFTVGGSVSGLSESGSLVLANGSDEITITENGSFTFPTAVTNGGSYNVTVSSNPTGQTASVENGTGTVSGGNVTNVTITCTNTPQETYLVGGSVSGLNGTLVLVNGEEEITITEDGPYVFPTPLADGETYSVKVKSDPESQQSTVANGEGTIDGADVTNANVTLTDLPDGSYIIGGTATGLAGGTLVLANGDDEIEITSDGPFQFPTPVADGAAYSVTIKSQPSGGFCTIANGSGTVSGANVTDIAVTCEATPTYTVGGMMANLIGTLVATNNGVDDLEISSNGAFTFMTPIANGSNYEVTIKTQPAEQLCTVGNGTGTIDGANVSSVEISCQEVPDVSAADYFVIGSEDPSIFYDFKSDLTLEAKSLAGMSGFSEVVGLAYDSDNNVLYGYSASPSALLSIDRTTGAATKIADLTDNTFSDLAYNKNSDILYAVEGSTLFTINITSGAVTEVESSGTIATVTGLTYDSNNDILYGERKKGPGGIPLKINTTSAVGIAVGTIGHAEYFSGLAYDNDNNKLYGMAGANGSDLYEINTTDGSIVSVGTSGVPGNGSIGLAYVDTDDKFMATWGVGTGKLFEVNPSNAGTMSIGSSGYGSIKDLTWNEDEQLIYGFVGQGTQGSSTNINLVVSYNTSNGTTTFKSEANLPENTGAVAQEGFTYDGQSKYYFTATDNTGLHLVSLEGSSSAAVVNPAVLESEVFGLAYDKESNILWAATFNQVMQLDVTAGTLLTETAVDVSNLGSPITALNFDPTKKVLVAATGSGSVLAIDPTTGDSKEIASGVGELRGITVTE